MPTSNHPTRSILKAGALALGVGVAGVASAFTVETTGETGGNPGGQPLYRVTVEAGDVGNSFDVDWLLSASTTNYPVDLAASATYTVTGFNSTTLDLDITFANDTDPSVQANILSFGFGVDPDADDVTMTSPGQTFDQAEINGGGQQNFPGGFKQIDICIFSQGCSGGNVNTGLAPGASDSISLSISGQFTDTVVMLSDFPVKFQGEYGSYQAAGTPENGTPPPPPPGDDVPEPATTGLLALGLAATLGLRRRIRRAG